MDVNTNQKIIKDTKTVFSFGISNDWMQSSTLYNYLILDFLKSKISTMDFKYTYYIGFRVKLELSIDLILSVLKKKYPDIEVIHADLWKNPGNNSYISFSSKENCLLDISFFKDGLSKKIGINYYGKDIDVNFFKDLEKKFSFDLPIINICWYYKAMNKLNLFKYADFVQEKFVDEAYPFISEGIDSFIKNYMDNKSPILIFRGPPGTGKTKLLRKIANVYNKSVIFTMDPELLYSDEFFIQFIDSESILVLEDMDNILKERRAGNSLMSKFLTASDGLLSINNKKIIFTTNVPSKFVIDEALLRPGRCFDIIDFRRLTYIESKKLLKKISKFNITLEKDKEYTIAELYAIVEKNNEKYKSKKK